MKNILVVNQPLNNRGDESAHKALMRKILSEMPDVKLTVLFLLENQNSIEQFSVHDDRVHYVNPYK